MFGHSTDDNTNEPQGTATVEQSAPGMASDMTGFTLPSMQNDATSPAPSPTDAPTVATPTPSVSPIAPSTSSDPVAPTDSPAVPAATDDDLLNIKQRALQNLSPLLGHLEQTPEEKFRTTMMMIQAADDQSLIKSAYEAAQAITDEKVRAQALLDVVNEINYFTQQRNG